ncbi:MAG: HU family DNA-binding protein [Thermoanaerobaculia bacterium]
MAGKAHIVDAVVDRVDGLTKKQAGEAFDAVFDSITSYLKRGERVTLPNFGSFSVTERAARKGRNPATGQEITIPASKNARFKPGKELKESVNR